MLAFLEQSCWGKINKSPTHSRGRTTKVLIEDALEELMAVFSFFTNENEAYGCAAAKVARLVTDRIGHDWDATII